MSEKVKLQLIDGFRHAQTAGRGGVSTGGSRGGDFLLRQLVGDVGDNELPLALKASEKRLNALLEDRHRIARDLHDCVLQSLYAIGLSLETSRRAGAQAAVPPSSPGDQVIAQLNKLIHEIRRMIRSLNDGTVQSFDLRAEIDELAMTYQQVGQLDIRVLLQPRALELLTHEEERELLNIAREALSNCVRHAHATRATVRLQNRKSRIHLAIADNGMGFSMADVGSSGFGLANMEARARKLGGMLHVRSRLGRGTTVVAEFALEPILTSV